MNGLIYVLSDLVRVIAAKEEGNNKKPGSRSEIHSNRPRAFDSALLRSLLSSANVLHHSKVRSLLRLPVHEQVLLTAERKFERKRQNLVGQFDGFNCARRGIQNPHYIPPACSKPLLSHWDNLGLDYHVSLRKVIVRSLQCIEFDHFRWKKVVLEPPFAKLRLDTKPQPLFDPSTTAVLQKSPEYLSSHL